MEINCEKLKQSLLRINQITKTEDNEFEKLLRLGDCCTSQDVDAILKYLGIKLLDSKYTIPIAQCFSDILLIIVSFGFPVDDSCTNNYELYQQKCIALSKLVKVSPEVLRYSATYFNGKPSPFKITQQDCSDDIPIKKRKTDKTIYTSLDIIKCCYNLLSSDPIYYKDLWDWWTFIEEYRPKENDLKKVYYNHIVSILTNMTECQLKQLNKDVPDKILIEFDKVSRYACNEINKNFNIENDRKILWNYCSNRITNIEGVLLPIYDSKNYEFYSITDGNYDTIVKVESTKVNLRSISLGISSGKAICLSGPVGCGKTTLLEYLARKTGRIAPKMLEYKRFKKDFDVQLKSNSKTVQAKPKPKVVQNKNKRKNEIAGTSNGVDFEEIFNDIDFDEAKIKNGFLRIQLGDQTDSKMLLGQYRCTDVPGEFIWLPGVLTQAVMNGYWLLLEDLDSATQETCTVLSNLLENNFLSVPGFRDCIRIEPGFQLFVTIRTQKTFNNSHKNALSLLEKYLYTVNILPLSRNELCHIIGINYPKLSTIAERIVDVFLTFSSGNHFVDLLSSDVGKTNKHGKEEYSVLPHETITSLPNSGRLISTRDLIKFCRRSNSVFSLTSTDCAYFIFQNAVDLFCSHLPQGPIKTKLIVSIGAKFNIIQSRCEFFSNEHRPDVNFFDEHIKIGRAELNIKDLTNHSDYNETDHVITKKARLDTGSSSKETVFSFTRLASCLLERITVSVSQNEPILLVGETGVGKTSSVQYLAHKTNHKLTVVNMNNQSDVSDLVGGFKPVDLGYVITPLRNEFELLFGQTFKKNKNEKFLTHISDSYNKGNFSLLIKVMVKIIDIIFTNNEKTYSKKLLDQWRQLHVKLLKLLSQIINSINISFAFIPGSLVNCIKNGNWVLLDEINLASAETLECLSTILEPDGSVVLLEKGDLTPIKRHPNFRIFACMNPNTDIGKKDLPVGIRNRFTEFFVDELTTKNDLMILVGDYLNNTGINKKKVLNIVMLYNKLRSLAQLELNDGLGNRPVFSLRTLCRSLTICAKNLCGSVERNLYESFCLSFLTQLDPVSHSIVLGLITEAMLSNSKAILSQEIPKPKTGGSIQFEGYWIENGTKDVLECENYILTDSVQQNLKDLARIISIGKLPILLQGPTSAGKTSLIEYVAKKSGNHCLRINNHEHTDLQEYIGTYTSDEKGKLSFKEGVLVQAMRNGFWIILDELNLAPTDILEALNRVLDDNRELYIPETQKTIKAHSNFMLFATQNPPGLYGGRKTLSRAFKNRFIELHFSEIPKPELEVILEKRCLIPKSYAKKMVLCMSQLQMNRTSTTKNNFTLRDLFRWGNRYTYADKQLLKNTSYDWNQHLVDEGYLVLSAKVRTDIEDEIIKKTLYTNFRKEIRLDDLFLLNDSTSLVTKHILEGLMGHTKRNDIIWTRNMTRMAVLTAKALEFDEPVLLVGTTGCGKTTVCQILASIKNIRLRILNCHMHTEGADFLGGLRPCRKTDKIEIDDEDNEKHTKKKLFEWADGPLVLSMCEGSYFMADEISLAEDSVLERLNCILEPDRTLLLAEKGGIDTNNNDVRSEVKISEEFMIKAKAGFQFLATMNPGGDFGKKELSPALRNRFTEIWCKPSDDEEDMFKIAANALRVGFQNRSSFDKLNEISKEKISNVLIKIVLYIRDTVEKFKFSIRDILAWCQYIVQNQETENLKENIIFGLETLFLDSLEMLPHESIQSIDKLRENVLDFAIKEIQIRLDLPFTLDEYKTAKGFDIEKTNSLFGIKPFFIEMNKENVIVENFFFDAPTTKKNLFRLLSALSVSKAILLEGPPGVGKTSIVENLARSVGYRIVRINLCEHTDLADLFGTDLPAEENTFDIDLSKDDDPSQTSSNLGSFVWRDGPLLAALKSENTWILLDELNLAPQSVLEGLNAILDHRGEVFIPELNKTFNLEQKTRIFASQNPLRQGGGRKGLPQSFLNRFTKVYLRKLTTEDLLYVVNKKHSIFFNEIKDYFMKILPINKIPEQFYIFNCNELLSSSSASSASSSPSSTISSPDSSYIHNTNPPTITFDLAERMVKFSEILDNGITNFEFGLKGGPFEINLRDILRWCELIANSETGFNMNPHFIKKSDCLDTFFETYKTFLLVLFERMKLVYYDRMRCDTDKDFIRNTFRQVFNCDANRLLEQSEDIGFYWTDSKIYLNDIILNRNEILSMDEEQKNDENCHIENVVPFLQNANLNSSPLILSNQKYLLKNLIECVYMEKPVILTGPADCGKTKVVDALCNISNKFCNIDTIDDSVMGSFQQIDLNRHLEDISQNVESILTLVIQKHILETSSTTSSQDDSTISKLFQTRRQYIQLLKFSEDFAGNATAMSDELVIFKKRVNKLKDIINYITSIKNTEKYHKLLNNYNAILTALNNLIKNSDSLNTGGHFEWIDSKIVKSLKTGQYICLEHINFCSSAILDRLNPIFEPDGNLLISEKGVIIGDEAEIVRKHKNFRAFLTIDPKNGELSRAMRNRCIEIAINNQPYTEDDLRQIIYVNGIHDVYLIKIILKIHSNIRELSELSNFNVSHLIKFAFLVSTNKRLGLCVDKAVHISAMEVYVHSSYTDILGYGLLYYRNKMQEIIKEECNKIKDEQEDNYKLDNIVITCNDLNSLSLIKRQCEPLKVLLDNFENKDESKIILTDILSKFKELNFENSFDLIKFYVYIIYESSTSDDVKLRYEYLKGIILDSELQRLNDCLFDDLKTHEHLNLCPNHLPWNHKLYPRIREYITSIKPDQKSGLRLSALLLYRLLQIPIEIQQTTKLSQMNAITYSKTTSTGVLADTLKNQFLSQLYTFLNSLRGTISSTLKYADINLKQYVNIVVAYLWINRLYLCSNEKLFISKELNINLLDKMLLHFKWLDKHLLNFIEEILPNYKQLNHDFDSSIQRIRNYSLSTNHPLNLIRKMYFKKMTNFLPFYDEKQIDELEYRKRYSNLIEIFNIIGTIENSVIEKKLKSIMSEESQQFKVLISKKLPEELRNLINIDFKEFNFKTQSSSSESSSLPESLIEKIKDFVEKSKNIKTTQENVIDFNELELCLEKIETSNEKSEDERQQKSCVSKILLFDNIFAREYFITKALCSIKSYKSRKNTFNIAYFQNVSSLNCLPQDILNIIESDHFKFYEEFWTTLCEHIQDISDSTELENVIETLSSTNYRSYSTFNRNLHHMIYKYTLGTFSTKTHLCLQLLQKEGLEDFTTEYQYHGPALTNSIFSVIFDKHGNLRPIGLGELPSWRNSLNDLRKLLWNNNSMISNDFDVETLNLTTGLSCSKKFLLEIDYIQKQCRNVENENFSDYNENFQRLVSKLNHQKIEATRTLETCENMHGSKRKQTLLIQSSLLNSLIGSIELSLLTFTPLIDPVEKNRLKHKYIEEDLDCLHKLTTVYDFMKIVMDYRNFGFEICNQLKSKITYLQQRIDKFSKKVALRPDTCIYSNLVQDINHYLYTNCNPSAIISLINDANDYLHHDLEINANSIGNYLLRIDELGKRLDLWIANSQRFVTHTLDKYKIYYRDFVQPIEVSITLVRYGFEGLKCCLTQQRNSIFKSTGGKYTNVNDNNKLCTVMENIIQFPSTKSLNVFDCKRNKNILESKSGIFTILDKVEESEFTYFVLLKAKLAELINQLHISSDIDEDTFNELDILMNIFNQIWQKEEENRRKRIIEDESLYVSKTRCATEDDEEIELQEIEDNFPTFVREDFGEFIVEDTLEKVIKISKPITDNNKSGKLKEIIKEDDLKIIGENFIYIMEQFAKLHYYNPESNKSLQKNIDFLDPFKSRIEVFSKLLNTFKPCLNSWIDETLYTAFSFIVGIQQETIQDISILDNHKKIYNFYKDGNIAEITDCKDILTQIYERTNIQLELYPDHASLNDIIRVIDKIQSLPVNSPVVRFSTGFQILRQKIAQWNEVAHKKNHLRDLEAQVAEYIQKWTRLELQFWRNCISQTFEKVEMSAYKYWFFIYNLLHEYLSENETDSNIIDFAKTEKRFEEGDYSINDKEETKTLKIQSEDIMNVLKQFIESSNYADFPIRMRLLRSFEFYVHYVPDGDSKRKGEIIAILRNLQIYFEQFANEIEESIKSMKTPIEKKLRELVKIESYNKDLSYISMRNNIARVHRNLNKFLKEFEKLLRNKISPVFQKKENMTQEYNLDNDKGYNLRYEDKIEYFMIDVKYFVAPMDLNSKLKKCSSQAGNLLLLAKADKLFLTSRKVSEDAIENTQFRSLIYGLDCLLDDNIETCDYLRNLEVDRTQDKPKQKLQAKHILSQKRKGLSDLYKTLSNLGISFKAGLMENTMRTELTDYKIEPFCFKNMFTVSKYKKLDQYLNYHNRNLDNYFAKCVFKLKLLQNVLLTPNSELGGLNTDRMKGYSIDLFLLIQNQRKVLSESIKQIYDLRQSIIDITDLIQCVKDIDVESVDGAEKLRFDLLDIRANVLKKSLCQIRFVFEQFILVLKCVPEEENDDYSALKYKSGHVLAKNTDNYSRIMEKSHNILKETKKALSQFKKFTNVEFLKYSKIFELESKMKSVINDIFSLKNEFSLSANEYLPIARSLQELLTDLEILNKNIPSQPVQNNIEERNIENIDNELENVTHNILLSLQKLYKKYAPPNEKGTNGDVIKTGTTSPSSKSEERKTSILENHLKVKIHKELLSDIETMNIPNILGKLENILLTIKYTENYNEMLSHASKIALVLPILEQFNHVGDYFLFQQLGANKVSSKMLSVMLTVFIELGTKGFCIPADLMSDEEEGEKKKDQKKGEGFGLEDGTGENDASDKIESEDQLDDAKRPEDRKNEEQKGDENCKEEKGIEMSEDFDANLQDVDKPEDDEEKDKSDEEDEPDKQMGETEEGAEKLDDQIWGSDEENDGPEEENEGNEEEEGKGSKEEGEQHNDLSSKNQTDKGKSEEEDGLDAANENDPTNKDKKQKEQEIDNMQEPEIDEEQTNTCHNELEEPPEPEDMDLGDNVNMDEENAKDGDDQGDENPFDIDKMKENMEVVDEDKDVDDDEEENTDKMNEDEPGTDSDEEGEAGMKPNPEEKSETAPDDGDEEEDQTENKEEDQTPGAVDETEEKNEDDQEEQVDETKKSDEYNESKDKATKEDNVQITPDEKEKGSKDNVQSTSDKDMKQDEDMDVQDTGEDKDGVGQAENDTSEMGHKGIADTKETQSSDKLEEKNETKEKRKQGNTNENRTLGEAKKEKLKQLKTIDNQKDKESDVNEEDPADEEDTDMEAKEYQHIKDPKNNDKVTLDNATEEQSKQIEHMEDEEENDGDADNRDDLPDDEETNIEGDLENIEDIEAEKTEEKSQKPSKSDRTKEKCETVEKMEIEGDICETSTVPRGDDTSAHCNKDVILDVTLPEENSIAETLDLRKMVQAELSSNKMIIPQHEDYEIWQEISHKMLSNARELCEQLRLILEPTKCTRLKGDYRTGRRINMKKIITYIATQFRKDKIWLRRTKPAQRDYKITIAIDDSKSMHHNNSKTLTLQAISLVSQALTLLESGKLNIVSFGESPRIILNHNEQFDGPKLVSALNFEQNQTHIAELLNFVRTINSEDCGSSGSDNGIFENLVLVLSDGRNIFSEGEQKVKNSIKLARMEGIFLVYIIIDNPENKHSILDIRVPHFSADRSSLEMKSYLDTFPFPYYVIVRDLGQLPIVLSEAMRHWFEMVNSGH